MYIIYCVCLINAAQYVRMVAKSIYCMKQIENCEGYFITREGEVLSARRKPTRIMKQNNNRGYREVHLYNNSRRKICKVHRLVAEAFIPNPLNLPQVNHINGVKNDNRVENLEWCSAQRNTELALAKTHLVEVVATGEVIEVYNLNKWCKDNGLHYCTLYTTNKKNRRQNQHGGYRLL